MKTDRWSTRHISKTYLALAVILAMPLLVNAAAAAKIKDRAPRYSFAFSATGLSDGGGNTIDIQGSGKFSMYAGGGWGPSYWFWNVWISGHGSITFVANGNKETIKWKLESSSPTGLYDQLSGTLNFTLKISGRLPDWVAEPIAVTLIEGGETTGRIIVWIGETSTYSGAGSVVIREIA